MKKGKSSGGELMGRAEDGNRKSEVSERKRFQEERDPREDTFNHFSGFGKVKILKSEYPDKKNSNSNFEKSFNLLSPLVSSSRKSSPIGPITQESSGGTFNVRFVETLPEMSNFLQSGQIKTQSGEIDTNAKSANKLSLEVGLGRTGTHFPSFRIMGKTS